MIEDDQDRERTVPWPSPSEFQLGPDTVEGDIERLGEVARIAPSGRPIKAGQSTRCPVVLVTVC